MHLGDVIDDRFLLEKKAGVGGMGVVYRALDRSSGVHVALKAVLDWEDEFDRFSREVNALHRIDHPRIVRYVAHGGTGENRYLVMEWLEGEDLAQRLARGPLNLVEAVQVIRGIAEALVVLHSADVIHRDIKPSNVFLVQGDLAQAKILDLGIARTRDTTWSITVTGSLLGTPAYMAPEQARGESVDTRADLFALGCIFYECLVGQSPFAAAHPVASLARILVEDAPRLRDSGVSVPSSVEILVESLLAKDRDARMPTASRVLEALDRLDTLKSLPPPMRASLTLGEQQIVSIVLTRPANDTDETLHAGGNTRVLDHVQSIAALYGARLERLSNGAYLALFSGTTNPRDLAANAARFALEMAALWGDDAIALTTGRGEISARLPVGAAIDRAVSLLRPNQAGIVMDSVSAALLEGRFKVEVHGEVSRLVGTDEHRGVRRTVVGKTSLFVGREREMATITSAWKSCMNESLASVVLITAPAGTGKSRLLDEVLQATALWDGISLTFMGACDMMNAGARYGVLARAVRPDVNEAPEDRTVRRAWLEQRIRKCVTHGDVEQTIELIAESCGLVNGDNGSAALRTLRNNPLLLADAIAEAWCAWLDVESSEGAVVFVLEDLHWGDQPTFALLSRMLRVLADRPIFVLGTARPEMHDLFPRAWPDGAVHEIRLGRIAARSAERLVKRFLGAGATNERIKQIVDRSGGHPFVLEELVRATLAAPYTFDEIPETVLGMVQARFFAKSERARAALRAASIFGGTFWRQGAEHLLGAASLALEFEELVKDEFISRNRSSKFQEFDEYSFRHALVRDAAYAMLTETDQRTGHGLAAEWLESVGEREPLVLAQHFDRGGAIHRAAHWYHQAAVEALEGNDLGRVIQWAQRAIECGRDGEELARTEMLLADARFGKGDLVDASTHAMSARLRITPGTDAWFAVTSLLIGSEGQRGHNDFVMKELESALAVCTTPPTDAQLVCIARGIGQYVWVSRERMEPVHQRLRDLAKQTTPGPLARGWLARANAEMIPHRWYFAADVAEQFEIAAREFDQARATRDATMMRLFQVMLLAYTEQREQAFHIAEKAIQEAEKRGLTYMGLFARLVHATAYFYNGQDQACATLLESHLPKFRHSIRLYGGGLSLLALLAMDAGDAAKANALSSEVVAFESMSDSARFSACGLHASTLVALGRVDEAVEWGERAFQYYTPGFMDPFGELAYIGLTEALLACGERERARSVIEQFWTIFLAMPLDHRVYPRRRIFRRIAALAASFGLPNA